MNWRRGVAVAVVQVAIVSSLAGKLLVDRATRPRVWVKTAPFDPELPIRGRYVALRLEVHAPDEMEKSSDFFRKEARLEVRDGELWAIPDERGTVEIQKWVRFGNFPVLPGRPASQQSSDELQRRMAAAPVTLAEGVDYFIPEHADDPSRRPAGEELWVEATIPKSGPPRPVRLGVKRDGKITPLHLQ